MHGQSSSLSNWSLRERNLGVAANRDLGIRDARGDFITQLDGDDPFLPTMIEAEAKALGQRSHAIACSDVRIIYRKRHRARPDSIAEPPRLDPSGRFVADPL
jgi:glycosyltransferase involved in cell wall biosynthesis